ncbi:MAG: hypothetical protein CMA88_02175 [Euryarchaeota archaeon]|nr:hypothetical protein [Euryarchaeota archaeon]
MAEDSDSTIDEEEDGTTKEVGSAPPPPPPGLDIPPPPPPPGLDNTQTDEDPISGLIDPDAARAMLLGISNQEDTLAPDLSETEVETSLGDSFEDLDGEEVEAPPPPMGFDAPPPPPMGFEEPETAPEEEEGEAPPPPMGFDAPPPPPMGFDAPPPPPMGFEEPESTQEKFEGSDEDLSSIDSLADSLSLLDEEWPASNLEEKSQPTEDSDGISNEIEQFSFLATTPSEDGGVSEVEQAIDAFGLVRESAFQQTDSSKPTRPSPFLRISSEVDSIPGDKLHATLSENEKTVLNPDGTIRKQFIDGELILRNSSKKHRAWDIEVHLESIESTDFGDKISTVKELDPTEETAIPYTASGPRMLILKESIDTEISRGEEPSLSLVYSETPQDIEISIEIENVSPVPLFDVEIKRTIPDSFILPEDSLYSIEQDSVVWDIGRMNIGETRNLTVSGRVETGSVDKINAGVSSVTYSAEATVSRARFDRVNGSGRQFSYVNAEEDDRPGVWHCTCVFENKSSFVVSLSGATVRLIGRDEPILDVSDIRQDVPPEGKWDSMVKRVESEEQPSFTQEIRFSILPRVSVQSTGIVELKEQQLTVLDSVLQKRFDKSRIKSYVSSSVDATITLENTGTSEINVIRILDDIPGIFETPSIDEVVIEMEGTELNNDQYRIDVVNGIQLEEKHISPDSEGHGLRITVGTSAPLGLLPGKTMLIRYPLKAPDPSPRNTLLVAPIKVDFSSERFGPVATRVVERPPQIKVVHKRRNISTGKEVFPGGKPGQYEIMLMFHNSSDSALDDLALHDIVPGTFTIEDSTIRSDKEGQRDASITKESARDGTQVTWAIGRIQQGERIEVLYTIQGDPEAEYKVSDAQDFHGATFGDEVDEEPNIPEWMERQKITIPPPSQETIEVMDKVDSEQKAGTSESEENTSSEQEADAPSAEKGSESDDNEEDPTPVGPNQCPACGFDVGIGSSICVVCGNTLS